MNNNSRNYAHESTLNHFSCDAGSKRRSSYAPLKNEDSGIMDDEKNTEVCPIAHPYFQTVFLIVLIFIFIFLWSPGLSYKPSSLPILLLDGWALHYHPPCFLLLVQMTTIFSETLSALCKLDTIRKHLLRCCSVGISVHFYLTLLCI